jgi:hypothetical protein
MKIKKTATQLDREIAAALGGSVDAFEQGAYWNLFEKGLRQTATTKPGVHDFWNIYEEELLAAAAKEPGLYMWYVEANEPPEVYAHHRRQGLEMEAELSGLGRMSLVGKVFKRVARRLGIREFSVRALKKAYAARGGKL